MTAYDAEVGVVGLGAWGAAALWRLAHRGVDVLGLERFAPGHAFGSSHGGSRMFRLTCYEHRGLVPLARRSLELFSELESAAGVPLVECSGGLLIGSPDGRMIERTLAHAAEAGIEVERLDAAAVAARFPQHADVPPGQVGVWEPSAGLLRPEAAVGAAVAAGIGLGARVHTDARVLSLETVADGVALHTPVRSFRVRRVVVAAGPWAPTLLGQVPLRILRKPISWFAPAVDPAAFSLARFPMFKRECPDGVVLWGCGAFESPEVKLGMEVRGVRAPTTIDPDVLDRSTTRADWRRTADVVARHVPGLDPLPTRVSVCIGTHTPDDQFALGPVDGDRRIVVATGESSQGFKHATGIGEYLAQVVVGEPPTVPLPFADPDRFAPVARGTTPPPAPVIAGVRREGPS